MTLDERLEEVLKIKQDNLDDTIVDLIELHSLFTKRYLKLMKELNEVEEQYENVWIERYSYYKVDYEIQLSTQEIKQFIEYDTETSSLRKRMKDIKAVIAVTEKQLKNIEQARWDVKNLIDYMKLKNGLL